MHKNKSIFKILCCSLLLFCNQCSYGMLSSGSSENLSTTTYSDSESESGFNEIGIAEIRPDTQEIVLLTEDILVVNDPDRQEDVQQILTQLSTTDFLQHLRASHIEVVLENFAYFNWGYLPQIIEVLRILNNAGTLQRLTSEQISMILNTQNYNDDHDYLNNEELLSIAHLIVAHYNCSGNELNLTQILNTDFPNFEYAIFDGFNINGNDYYGLTFATEVLTGYNINNNDIDTDELTDLAQYISTQIETLREIFKVSDGEIKTIFERIVATGNHHHLDTLINIFRLLDSLELIHDDDVNPIIINNNDLDSLLQILILLRDANALQNLTKEEIITLAKYPHQTELLHIYRRLNSNNILQNISIDEIVKITNQHHILLPPQEDETDEEENEGAAGTYLENVTTSLTALLNAQLLQQMQPDERSILLEECLPNALSRRLFSQLDEIQDERERTYRMEELSSELSHIDEDLNISTILNHLQNHGLLEQININIVLNILEHSRCCEFLTSQRFLQKTTDIFTQLAAHDLLRNQDDLLYGAIESICNDLEDTQNNRLRPLTTNQIIQNTLIGASRLAPDGRRGIRNQGVFIPIPDSLI